MDILERLAKDLTRKDGTELLWIIRRAPKVFRKESNECFASAPGRAVRENTNGSKSIR